jgi:hypothetical protein
VAGNLEVISIAGGMLRLPQPLDPNTRASLMFLSDGGPVLGKAEMLGPLLRLIKRISAIYSSGFSRT